MFLNILYQVPPNSMSCIKLHALYQVVQGGSFSILVVMYGVYVNAITSIVP